MVTKNHQSRWHSSNFLDPDTALDFGPQPERRLDFLILAHPWAPLANPDRREIVSVSLREGIDTLDELDAEFGDFYILATGDPE